MWIPIRIEQIAAGAAVHGANLPAEAKYLRPDDFSYTTGAAAFAAVVRARQADPQADPLQVAQRAAPMLADHFVSGQALLAYAAMAAQTDPEQVATAHQVLLRQGSDEEFSSARQRIINWNRDKEDPAAHLAELEHAAGALHRAVQRRGQLLAFLPADVYHELSHIWHDWSDNWNAPLAPANPNAQWLHAEKAILAGLIQHPRLLWTVGPWLDFSTFASQAHQDAFDNIMILGEDFARSDNPLASLCAALAVADRTAIGRTGDPQSDKVTPQVRQQELRELKITASVPTSPFACVQAASDLIARDLSERASRNPNRAGTPAVFTEPNPTLALPQDPKPRL